MDISLLVLYKTYKENINLCIDYNDDAYDMKKKLIKKLYCYNQFNKWLSQNRFMHKIIKNDIIFSNLPIELYDIIWGYVKKDLNMQIFFNGFEVSNDDILFWFAWSRCNHTFSSEDKFLVYLN